MLALLLLVTGASAHVRLTFPPARAPALDFLDNTRTLPHCGIPKPDYADPSAVRTTLEAGSTITVSWFMAYPHQGGVRIELLNSRDEPFAVLTPAASTYVNQANQTGTELVVTLPAEECRNCGIRLIRQASEWGRYRFWSCADIDILPVVDSREKCSGQGSEVDGVCVCDQPYSGRYCSIKNECVFDGDCNGGMCQDRGAKADPQRVCYCRPGYHGFQCKQESNVAARSFNPDVYQYRGLGDDASLRWRILQVASFEESSEVEMVLQMKTGSWMAVGWRPLNVNPQCAKLPEYSAPPPLPPQPEPVPEGEVSFPEPGAEPGPEPGPEPYPEPAAEPEAGPEPYPEGTTDEYPYYEEYSIGGLPALPALPGDVGQASSGKVEVSTESTLGRTFDAGFVTASFSLAPTPEPLATPEPTPPPEVKAEVIGDLCYGDWRYPEGCRDCEYRISWAYQEDGDEIEFSVETRAPSRWWTGVGVSRTGNMSDADMLIVKSKSGVLTLHDMYSSDLIAEPAEDLQQDLHTSTVVGTHQNGVIRATFSRSRDTRDRDHDLAFTDSPDGCYYLLFPVSGGRLDPEGRIQPPIETPVRSAQKVCIRPCYSSSEEGLGSLLPGTETVAPESIVDGTCETEYRFPTGCIGEACIYHAAWAYDMDAGDVQFTIASKEVGRWTGIGFSRDGNMTNSDIYTGWVSLKGQAFVTDRFAFGRQLPAIDKGRQDVYDLEGKIEGDIQTISFKRKAITDDSLTDFPLTECYYFLFPIGGGRVLARQEEDFEDPETAIGFHDRYPPRSSKNKICICAPLEENARRKRQAAYPEPLSVGEPHSHAEPHPEPHPEPEHSHPEPVPEGEGAPNLHPMDCMDIVVGSAVGAGLSRVGDYYTVSRATPLLDEAYGGSQSLTGAIAWEEDGMTTMVFRRKIHTGDAFGDHSIINGNMEVIWAKGQEKGLYHHSPASGLDDATSDYYTPDVLMYHGRSNRGHFTTNFHAENDAKATFCHGGYQYPEGCYGSLCQYNITYYREADEVHFTLEATMEAGRWSGIGFSKEGLMAGSDMILASVLRDGSVEVTDRYSPSYSVPEMDTIQDIYNVQAKYEAGRLRAKFTRDLSTGDSSDADLAECQYFIFPYSGGYLMDSKVGKHSDIPSLSAKQICLNACQRQREQPRPEPEGEPEPQPETKAEPTPEVHRKPEIPQKKPPTDIDAAGPPGVASTTVPTKFLVSLRILNENWREGLKKPGSAEHNQLTRRLVSAVDSLLKAKLPGYSNTRIIRYKGERGNVGTTAEMEVVAAGHKETELVNAIQPAVSLGQLEGLEIDAQKITATRVPDGASPEEIRNWIIIGVACFLVTAAILFAICMILRTKKSKSRDLGAYQGAYPGGAMYGAYPPPMPAPGIPDKGPAYDAAELYGRAHNRQYSQATTASQPPAATSASPEGSQEEKPAQGEQSYGEWYNRVAEGAEAGSQARRPRPGYPGPFVSYPNDPYNYYTINGHNRAPPAHNPYRPY